MRHTLLRPPLTLPQQVCSDTMSFDLPAAALAGAIEELGIAAEIAANKGDAPVNIYNELGEQGEQCWHAVWPLVSTAGLTVCRLGLLRLRALGFATSSGRSTWLSMCLQLRSGAQRLSVVVRCFLSASPQAGLPSSSLHSALLALPAAQTASRRLPTCLPTCTAAALCCAGWSRRLQHWRPTQVRRNAGHAAAGAAGCYTPALVVRVSSCCLCCCLLCRACVMFCAQRSRSSCQVQLFCWLCVPSHLPTPRPLLLALARQTTDSPGRAPSFLSCWAAVASTPPPGASCERWVAACKGNRLPMAAVCVYKTLRTPRFSHPTLSSPQLRRYTGRAAWKRPPPSWLRRRWRQGAGAVVMAVCAQSAF